MRQPSLGIGNAHIEMVGGVCRLADPVIVERIVRLGCDNIFVRVINSSLAPRRTILARDAAHIHAHTIGKGNGLELNLVLLFASVGVLLANPTGWEERFAKVLEQSGIWDSFAKEFAEPFVAYLVQTRQYLDAFSDDPSCWESICKNLMAAVKDRKTVRLNIEAGDKSMQVVYPAVGIESYDTIRTKSLDTFVISPVRHQEEVEHFLEENCQWYGRGHQHSIPFKVIVSVSSGRKVLWENPLFGK